MKTISIIKNLDKENILPDDSPFKLSDVEDVRIIIKAKNKHYSLVANDERCKKEDVDARMLRIVVLNALLNVHDIVVPALEDIK